VATTQYVAMALSVVVLLASMISVELGVSIAVVEIVLGIVVGNLLHLPTPAWLTFLAGAEVDPGVLRDKLKESLVIGGLSFLLPFAGGLLVTRYGLGGTGGRPRSAGSPCPRPRWRSSMRCWSRPA
jgi:Kef-type K+ transport system membrane component KefB